VEKYRLAAQCYEDAAGAGIARPAGKCANSNQFSANSLVRAAGRPMVAPTKLNDHSFLFYRKKKPVAIHNLSIFPACPIFFDIFSGYLFQRAAY